jgi:hypothetical protein
VSGEWSIGGVCGVRRRFFALKNTTKKDYKKIEKMMTWGGGTLDLSDT